MKICTVIFFFVFCCLLTEGFAQTADMDANNDPVVTLDMSTRRFNKVFPFDRYFVIHITNIAPAYDIIQISIYQNKNAASKLKTTGRILASELEKDNAIYVLDSWSRPADAVSITETDIIQPFKLKPNTDYIVKVESGYKTAIKDPEKTALETFLNRNVNIALALNGVAHLEASEPSSILATAKGELNNYFEKGVKEFNASYEYTKPDLLSLLSDLASFRNAILNVSSAQKDVHDVMMNKNQVVELNAKISQIDWGTIRSDTKGYKDISGAIESIKKADSVNNGRPTTLSANADAVTQEIDAAIAARDALKAKMIAGVIIENTYDIQVMNSTYRADFVNNAKFQINLDAGYAYVSRVDRAIAYSGFNVYFRPVDKIIPLSHYHGFWNQAGVRTSLLIGISLSSIEKDNVRKGLIDNKAFIIGLGVRTIPFLKINGGVFCHYRYDKNPVIDPERYRFSMSPFISLSLDLDVRPLFNGLSDSLFK